MTHLQLELDYTAPFDLRHHDEPGGVRRSFYVTDTPLVVRLAQKRKRLLADVYSDRDVSRLEPSIRAACHRLVSAHDDLTEFQRAVRDDSVMLQLATRYKGLKPLRIPDLWTSLVRSLISQQISVAAARAIRERLATRFGTHISAGDELIPVLPPASVMAAAEIGSLREAGLSQRKAEYIKGIAEALNSGEIDLHMLGSLEPSAAIERLAQLRGIGVWTAECTLIFAQGERDVLPADDLGVRKAVAAQYGMDVLPAPAAVRVLGQQWAGWRSYATVYLWRSLRP